MSCEDLPTTQELENNKLRIIHFGELIDDTPTGTSANPITGVTLKTYAQQMREVGFKPASFNFVTGGTLAIGDVDKAIYNPAPTGDNNWYSWGGNLPHDVAAGTDPTAPGSGYVQRTDDLLRNELAADGGAQLVKNSVRWFDSIQSMLAATSLEMGQKVRTGASTWKIVSSNKGWPLDNGTQYALPLNGVYVEDAGADPLGVADSYTAIMYVVNNYNADTKRRFAVCFGGGYYKTSGEIALHALTSFMHINGGGAILEATANMNALLSCPGITSLRLKGGLQVQHSAGVTIANAMVHINNESGNANKTSRHIIDDISVGLITGAPKLLLCEKMWESDIRRIRADRDVSGMTGEIVELRSCINCTIHPCEVGYCATAWRLSKNASVSYGCEGITFLGGITAYAKVPIAVDNGTAIRIKGMVMDFCESSGPTFTNGADATIDGCWVANTSASSGWNGVVSLPTFSDVKVVGGNHFVNNSSNTAYCGSINSPDSIFAGNTSQGCLPGFRYANGVQEYGNQHGVKGVGINQFRGASLRFAADTGTAPANELSSGIASASADQLLQRLTLNAPLLNAANSVEINHYQGSFSDIPVIRVAWNGVEKYELNMSSGDIRLINAGSGIRMTSPNGLVTKTIRLSNAGVIEYV